MIKLVSITLVLLGLICLFSSLKPAYKVSQDSDSNGWWLLTVLIGTFTIGYAGFLLVLLFEPVSVIELGLATILGGGGAFVIVIIHLSLKSIEQAHQRAAREFYDARHDGLTGLPNRMHFMEYLNNTIVEARAENSTFAVLMMDLDRFKEINDTLGHAIGDKLLNQLGRRLNKLSHEHNIISRLGGDEFALVLPTGNEQAVIEEAKRVSQSIEDQFLIDDHALVVDMSIGISLYPRDGLDQESLLKRADIAMYLAKDNKQHFMLYNEAEDSLSPQRLGLISRVKEALTRDEFELYYQPVFFSQDCSLTGFEALIRWRQSDGSFIPPSEFIPQIEKSRFIGSVSRWVIRRSIQQLQSWSRLGLNLSMSLNLSVVDLQNKELVQYIKDCIDEFGVSADRLCFEITESAIMVDSTRAKEVVNSLIGLGAKIALDDFGTGYSSLSLLREIPAQIIKIDQSFVKDIVTSSESRSIVKSMVELCHNLGRTVVAEGVEDELILNNVREIGCDVLQGYHLSRPMSYNHTTKWLEEYVSKNGFEVRKAG